MRPNPLEIQKSQKEGPSAHQLRLLSTDGHRLAEVTHQNCGFHWRLPQASYRFLAPAAAMRTLLALTKAMAHDEFLTLFCAPALFHAQGHNWTLQSRLVEGAYPQVDNLIPARQSGSPIPREACLEAIRRVSLVSPGSDSTIQLHWDRQTLILQASDPHLGHATDRVSLPASGPTRTAAFRPKYLIDAMAVMDGETVEMAFDGPISPCQLTDPKTPSFRYVVMPIKLQATTATPTQPAPHRTAQA